MIDEEMEVVDRIAKLKDMIFIEKMSDSYNSEAVRRYQQEIRELEALLEAKE